MDKNYKAIVDDGTREVPIVNKFGKPICKVYFRPADYSILERYNDVVAGLEEMLKPLQDIDIKNDGTAQFDKDWGIIQKVENDIKDKINYLFDMEEADEIFAKRKAFASVNGHCFCILVLNALGDVITKAIEDETKLSKKRIDKYLADIKKPTKGLKVTEGAGAITDEP